MGGTDHPDNLVELTIAEHADAHNLLYCLHKSPYDKAAELFLLGQINASEAANIAKIEGCRLGGHITGKGHKGKPKSEEHKRKLKIARNKRGPMSEESKRKMSETKKGKVFTAEHRENLRLAALRRYGGVQ